MREPIVGILPIKPNVPASLNTRLRWMRFNGHLSIGHGLAVLLAPISRSGGLLVHGPDTM
jgi:hypothetical protein